MTPHLSEKDQELIEKMNLIPAPLMAPTGKQLLSIISRYQKALEKAVEQRDEEIDLITTHGYFSSNGKDGHNFEIQNILNGGEE